MAGEKFAPKVEVSLDAIAKLAGPFKSAGMKGLKPKIVAVDSEDPRNRVANMIDGNNETFWHSKWQSSPDAMPHHVIIDLGREVTLKGVIYLPRQDMSSGRIEKYEIFAGNDTNRFGAAVAQGKWANSEEDQKVMFKAPVKGRYLKLVTKSGVNGQQFAAVAELDIITDEAK
jgi:beta-galactosidase